MVEMQAFGRDLVRPLVFVLPDHCSCDVLSLLRYKEATNLNSELEKCAHAKRHRQTLSRSSTVRGYYWVGRHQAELGPVEGSVARIDSYLELVKTRNGTRRMFHSFFV